MFVSAGGLSLSAWGLGVRALAIGRFSSRIPDERFDLLFQVMLRGIRGSINYNPYAMSQVQGSNLCMSRLRIGMHQVMQTFRSVVVAQMTSFVVYSSILYTPSKDVIQQEVPLWAATSNHVRRQIFTRERQAVQLSCLRNDSRWKPIMAYRNSQRRNWPSWVNPSPNHHQAMRRLMVGSEQSNLPVSFDGLVLPPRRDCSGRSMSPHRGIETQ